MPLDRPYSRGLDGGFNTCDAIITLCEQASNHTLLLTLSLFLNGLVRKAGVTVCDADMEILGYDTAELVLEVLDELV